MRIPPSGYGFLKINITAFNEAAKDIPYLILTDLDDNPCAATLGASWLKSKMHPNLIFRVAIREVEAASQQVGLILQRLADLQNMSAIIRESKPILSGTD